MAKDKKRVNNIMDLHSQYNTSLEEENTAKIRRIQNEKLLLNECLREYGDPDVQNQLLEEAKKYCYSTIELEKLRESFKDWNQDTVSINTVEDIISAECHIREFRKRSSIIEQIGSYINEILDKGGGGDDC